MLFSSFSVRGFTTRSTDDLNEYETSHQVGSIVGKKPIGIELVEVEFSFDGYLPNENGDQIQ